ncbi:uncharacterized protein TNCV_513321 [Trichonephila clavipes]|nr:uncharacterized protein TNCV_513321 [Trichonephila clavipes]
MALRDSLPQINLGVQGGTQGGSHSCAQRKNPEFRVGDLIFESSPSRWALDWFEVLGYRVVEDKATDYAHLKQALTEQFPVIRNRKRQENWRETRGNNRYSDNSRPQREFNKSEGQGVADNRRFDSRRRGGQYDHRFHN